MQEISIDHAPIIINLTTIVLFILIYTKDLIPAVSLLIRDKLITIGSISIYAIGFILALYASVKNIFNINNIVIYINPYYSIVLSIIPIYLILYYIISRKMHDDADFSGKPFSAFISSRAIRVEHAIVYALVLSLSISSSSAFARDGRIGVFFTYSSTNSLSFYENSQMTRGVREDVWGDNIMNGSDFYDRDNFIGNHLTELYTRATGVHPYSVSIDIVNEEGYYIEVESSTILFTGGPPRSLPDVTEGDGLNRRVQINITGAAMDAERSKVQIPPYSTATLTLFNYTGHIESFLDKPLRVGLASEYREKLVSNILLFEIDGISTALDGSDYEIYSSDGMIDGVPSSVFYRSTITISKRNDVSHRDIYSLRGSFSSMPASIIYGSDIFVVHNGFMEDVQFGPHIVIKRGDVERRENFSLVDGLLSGECKTIPLYDRDDSLEVMLMSTSARGNIPSSHASRLMEQNAPIAKLNFACRYLVLDEKFYISQVRRYLGE